MNLWIAPEPSPLPFCVVTGVLFEGFFAFVEGLFFLDEWNDFFYAERGHCGEIFVVSFF